MAKKATPKQLRRASAPQLDPADRSAVTRGDLEDVFSRLATATPVTKSENREPTRAELRQRHKLVRRSSAD